MNWVLWQRQTTEYSLVPDPTDSLADRLIVVTGSVSFTPHRMTPVFVEKSKRHVKVAIRAIVAHHTISLQGVLYINKSLFNLVVETYCYEYPSHIAFLYIKTTSQIQTPFCKHFSWTKTGNAIRLNGVAESSSFKL